MLAGIERASIQYPAAFNRLFPSITSATADPAGSIIPSGGAGAGLAEIVPWNVYPPSMADLFSAEEKRQQQAAEAAAAQRAGFMGTGLRGLGEDEPGLFTARLAETVRRLDDLIVSDYMVSPSVLAHGAVLAAYFGPEYAQHPDTINALNRLRTRYDFYRRNYPGTDLMWAGSTMPSGSTSRPPIVLQYRDGSFAYAPGFGPVSQYGALQVQSSTIPPQPRLSAYTGQVVGSVSPVDVVGAVVPATQTLATGGGDPGPGTGGGAGAGTGASGGTTTPKSGSNPITLIPSTDGIPAHYLLYAGGGLLVLAIVASLSGRR